MKIKLGCDPELFLADVNGKLMASCGLIGGTKAYPQPLIALGEGYAVQEDNVAIEFNIPPAANAREYRESIKKTLDYLRNGVKTMYGFDIVNLSAAYFEKDQLVSKAAQEFGCDPDYNAWTGKRNPKPAAADETLRSCGGHVHIGYEGELDKRQLIKCMDLFVGVPLQLMDKGDLRKELYGKRGAYRDKPYGVEYRTPSNFWVVNDLADWMWRNTEKAVKAVESQFAIDDYNDGILDAIDNNNREAASYLVAQLDLEVLNV